MMKKQILLLVIPAVLTLLFLSGCYYDVEDRLYPKSGCDTSHITYAVSVINVLQNNGCMSCHSGTASSGGNIILDTYAGLKVYSLNGHLLGSINQQAGFFAMPLGGNKMNSCDINKLTAWINAGSPNN